MDIKDEYSWTVEAIRVSAVYSRTVTPVFIGLKQKRLQGVWGLELFLMKSLPVENSNY